MTHQQYRRMIDRLLDGKLDFVEVAELQLHENDCKQDCLGRMIDRAWERLEERDTFLPANPQPCLRDETLRRWLAVEVPAELYPMISEHFQACQACREKSLDLAMSEAETIAC